MHAGSLLQNEALVDAQNHQKSQPFCGPGLKGPAQRLLTGVVGAGTL